MKIFLYPVKLVMVLAFVLLLAGCEKVMDLEKSSSTPKEVFNELWKEIDRRYALFPLKKADWDSVYEIFSAKIRNDMGEQALFMTLSEMLETLNDGHLALMSDFDTARYDNFYRLYPANFNYGNLVNNYLDGGYEFSGSLLYAVKQDVGYLYVKSFGDPFTAVDIDRILQAFSNTRGLIVDVRSNPGGSLNIARTLASVFFRERTLVSYERLRIGEERDALSGATPRYVDRGPNQYERPVIVLTNRACFSACNDFVLYMSQLRNVRIYGDRTGGGGSIPMSFVLSNGWRVQYSSTMTLSPQMLPVEAGLDPDLQLQISSLQESVGVDPILEKAFLDLK